MSTTPCYGCPDRQMGCHGSCPAYQAFRSERDEINRLNLAKQRSVPSSAMAKTITRRRTKAKKHGRKL